MASISLCMIVKDEEDVIERCLKSVSDIVDEIIIVDTGSNDDTKVIASKFTNKIYGFKWIDDFSAARNYSFSKATKDYILWLDADDVLLEEDRIKFKQLKEDIQLSIDVVMMKYNVGFDKNGKVNFSYYRERLCKRVNGYKWIDPIHEYMGISGNIINSNIAITHSKVHPSPADRNIKIFEKLISQGKKMSPRNILYYAKELYYNAQYNDAIKYFNEFLDTEKGWIEDNISACRDISICYKNINDSKNRLKALIRSFEYDNPRAEICCELGYYYKELNNYEKAIFWFEVAANTEMKEESWGFILHDCYGYIPNIELCVCYDNMGNIEKAMEHNSKAGKYKPDNPAVLYNKEYFSKILNIEK